MPGKNRWQPKKYPLQFYSEVSKRGLAYALKSFARAPALLAKRSNPQDCYFRSCCVDYYRPAGLIAQALRAEKTASQTPEGSSAISPDVDIIPVGGVRAGGLSKSP